MSILLEDVHVLVEVVTEVEKCAENCGVAGILCHQYGKQLPDCRRLVRSTAYGGDFLVTNRNGYVCQPVLLDVDTFVGKA